MQRFPWWHWLVVVAVCLLAYGNALEGALVWDDEVQIVKNQTLRSLSNLPEAFTHPFWGFANASGPNQTNFYRPLQAAAYTLAYWWSGLSPGTFHLMNLTMHAVASLFVYLICLELGLAPALSLVGAALFAAHPIHTEAVAWIAGLPDVACGAFYFAALWAFLKSGEGQKRSWWIASAALLFPALLAKEMALTFPALVLLYVYRPGGSRRAKLVLPYAVPVAIYVVMRVNALGFLATTQSDIQASMLDWATLTVRVFGQYIWQTLAPYPQAAFHLIAIRFADRVASTLAAAALAGAVGWLAWRSRQWFWCAAFALMLIPVFYFKGISNALLAERYLYIPSLAAVVVAGTLLARKPKLIWAGWVVVALFTGLTVARNRTWGDRERFYADSVRREPEAAHMRVNLADILLKRGDDRGAEDHLKRALESINTGKYWQISYDAYRVHIGLGAILARQQRFDEAREHLETAKRINPAGEWPYLYLGGIAMEAEHDDAKAVEQLKTAVFLGPLNEVARDYLGIALFNQGKLAEAKAEFEEALKINPGYADARRHLAMVQERLSETR